jgi:glycosyltransferase involved in cell wall biosynthesis
VLIRAADPEKFKPHVRTGKGKVGFSTAFYERKRPELVLSLAKALPHRNFVLLGKRWSSWERFDELKALPNFEYLDASYEAYPSLYRQMDVFVSPAVLEGGPFPLLEAMMSNIVPVASRTGFAPDLIESGKNGFLFDVDADVSVVASLVEKAYELKGDVASGVQQYTWKALAEEMANLIGV